LPTNTSTTGSSSPCHSCSFLASYGSSCCCTTYRPTWKEKKNEKEVALPTPPTTPADVATKMTKRKGVDGPLPSMCDRWRPTGAERVPVVAGGDNSYCWLLLPEKNERERGKGRRSVGTTKTKWGPCDITRACFQNFWIFLFTTCYKPPNSRDKALFEFTSQRGFTWKHVQNHQLCMLSFFNSRTTPRSEWTVFPPQTKLLHKHLVT
jgi:hypothetical protein